MTGTLYVVATPIGNLADCSFRAISVLRSVSVIFCEDTRVTRKLLAHYALETPLVSYHSFSGFGKIRKAVALLESGEDIALVSDAGTPSISDPGVKFVRQVRDTVSAVRIFSVPGVSAVTAALSVSGAPASSFLFLGFLPRKKGRESIFREIADESRTVVFYESPHRLLRTLDSLRSFLSTNREVIVVREMTKVHEQVVSGTAADVFSYYEVHPDEVRGEVVIVISSLVKR